MLAILLILACGDGAEDTAADRAAISRTDFVHSFGPAWCAARAGCVDDLASCGASQSEMVDGACVDYDPGAGTDCIEALEALEPGDLCGEVYPESVQAACGDACGW